MDEKFQYCCLLGQEEEALCHIHIYNTSRCCRYLKWPEGSSALCQIKVNMFLNLKSASVKRECGNRSNLSGRPKLSHPQPEPDPQAGSWSSCEKSRGHSRTTTGSSCPLLHPTDFRAPTSLPWGASDFTLVEGGTLGNRKGPWLEPIATEEPAPRPTAIFQSVVLTICMGISYAKSADSGFHLGLLRQDLYGEAWNIHFHKHSR